MPEIKVGNPYIATRGEKQQLVHVDASLGGDMYECSYGVVSFHECVMRSSQLRHLSPDEYTKLLNHQAFSLPQQFYQSGPPGCASMDAR